MGNHKTSPVTCSICGKSKPLKEMMPVEFVRDSIGESIKKDYPDWKGDEGYICMDDLNYYRTKHIENVLADEKGDTSKLEKQVIRSLKKHELISENINTEFDRQLTFGERIADRVAEFGGSWRFIIIFASILLFWILLNSIILLRKPFDPYPFILLNLVLSTLAAIQAPIIMMSQNRQEDKDRLRSEHDYRVNLKAELEVRHLNEKMDHLMQRQWQRLLEIQQIQTDLIEELSRQKPKPTAPPAPVPPTPPAQLAAASSAPAIQQPSSVSTAADKQAGKTETPANEKQSGKTESANAEKKTGGK